MRKDNYNLKFFILIAVFLFVLFGSLFIGRFKVSLDFTQWAETEKMVLKKIRIPRILGSSIIGACLSVSGLCYQGMFRNPMVSPDLLGSSTGAGFGAAVAILLGFSYYTISAFSFAFGLVAVFLAVMVSKKSRIDKTLSLVLSGVMISSLFSSATSFVKLVSDTDTQLPAITFWLMGSLASIKEKDLLFLLITGATGLVPIFALRWRINLLTVSEAEARSMGVETVRLRNFIIFCATLITSASVAVSGMIGWVGLVIPHFSRILVGNNYKKLVPCCAVMGATFLLIVDDLARTMASSEIPIGILTSFVGAPVFIYLIMMGGRNNEN